jgi:ATP-dependent RNA helicase DDX47/RRP3
MTDKVEKLERAALTDPVKVSVASKYQTVDQLRQEYLFFPSKLKETYLAYILQQKIGKDVIVFTLTCLSANRICLLLRKLGHNAVTVNGQMSQTKRLGSLARFRTRDANILVATDVASRGLDIPSVDLVLNYDLPMNPKDYIHRVGRTARAGRAGRSISFITQYDIEDVQKIEALIGKKLEQYQQSSGADIESAILSMQEMVQEKARAAGE